MNSLRLSAVLLAGAALAGCGSQRSGNAEEFRTSGSRDADQRAEQRISAVEEARGNTDAMRTLYERLGGDKGVNAIVSDFVERALVDPRVNWTRSGVKRGGVLGVGGSDAKWRATEAGVAGLKLHLAQFIAVATGGPTLYTGEDMKRVHDGMDITNAEFDATIGDLKASLDALRVGVAEQKELLALFESVRPQVAEVR